ncbi:hypothetical protein MNBD_BACTEROID05-371 [hydrothermal vent metagenome]|uniref:Uncharacterized protein n=1 Tax=hydrothermal vent metagenome TaxID=652676 RepID=A0A3B0U3G9_9ZZZZ
MKKFLMIVIVMVGLMTINSGFAFACLKDKTSCDSKSGHCKISKLKEKVKSLWVNQDALGITDDQLDSIKDIKYVALKKLIQLKADKEIVLVDFHSAIWKDLIDVNKVNNLIDAKYKSKNKSAKTYVKAMSDIQKILSKEQRNQWRTILKKVKLGEGECSKFGMSSDKKLCPLRAKTVDDQKFCPLMGESSKEKGSSKGSMK